MSSEELVETVKAQLKLLKGMESLGVRINDARIPRGKVVWQNGVTNEVPLILGAPVFLQQIAAREAAYDPRPLEYQIGLWDLSGGQGSGIPREALPDRFGMICGRNGIVLRDMKPCRAGHGHLIYEVGDLPAEESARFEYLERGRDELYHIRRKTDHHVYVVFSERFLPETERTRHLERGFKIPYSHHYEEFARTVRTLGYSLLISDHNTDFLDQCAVLVTRSPQSTVEALLEGVQVINRDQDSGMSSVCPGCFDVLAGGRSFVDDLDRDSFLHRLAYTQWSEREIADGSMLAHYLPEIREQMKYLAFRPEGRTGDLVSARRLPVSVPTAEICGRILKLNPAWQYERYVRDWSMRGRTNEEVCMKVWSLSHCIRENDCVLVAGAGMGFSSLVAIGAGAAEVFAFEPNPALFHRLQSLDTHGIQALPFALGNHEGTSPLFLSDVGNHLSTLQMDRVTSELAAFPGKPEVTVSVRSLDALCEDFEFDVMLLNTNGSSLAVLEGAATILSRRKPRAIIAVIEHYEEESLVEHLKSFSYSWARVESGDEGWCRLLYDELAACGHSNPLIIVFHVDQIFPHGGSWSSPAQPRSIDSIPSNQVNTRKVIKELPIGHYGLVALQMVKGGACPHEKN